MYSLPGAIICLHVWQARQVAKLTDSIGGGCGWEEEEEEEEGEGMEGA
jgi:hypothetical protein